MNVFLLAIVSILLSVGAQFLLKHGMSSIATGKESAQHDRFALVAQIVQQPYIALGFLLYGLSALVWLGVLSKWDVSKAYPIVGAGFVITFFVGAFIGEAVTTTRLFGCALICAGVIVIART